MAEDFELIVPFGLRERLLPGFDDAAFAKALAPLLDRGDKAGASALWANWRERAERVLTRKRIAAPVRERLLRDLSAGVRLQLYAIRGSAALGPVPAKPIPPAPPKPSATVFDLKACRRARGAA